MLAVISPVKRYVLLLAAVLMSLSALGGTSLVLQGKLEEAGRHKITHYHLDSTISLLEIKLLLREVINGVSFHQGNDERFADASSRSVVTLIVNRTRLVRNEINALRDLQDEFADPFYAPATSRLFDRFETVNSAVRELERSFSQSLPEKDFILHVESFEIATRQLLDLHNVGADRLAMQLEQKQAMHRPIVIVLMLVLLITSLLVLRKGLRLIDQVLEREREALRESTRLGAILEESLNEILIVDGRTLRIRQANRGALRNMGYDAQEIGKLTLSDVFPEYDLNSIHDLIRKLAEHDLPILTIETIQKRKDSSTYPVEVRLQRDDTGNATIVVAFVNDITERKRAEMEARALQESLEQRVELRTAELQREIANRKAQQDARTLSEQRLRAILDTAADGIVTINERGIIESFNAAAEEIFGVEASTAIGSNVSILMPTEYAARHDAFIAAYLNTGAAKIIGTTRELMGKRGDGSLFPMELAVSETRSGEQVRFTGIVRDISDRKTAEETLHKTIAELRQTQKDLVESEKMASLGGLVAGVAHEINTPVGVSLTAASALRQQATQLRDGYKDGRMRRSDLDGFVQIADETCLILETNLRRAAELIRSFKQVAVDRSDSVSREINLKEYIEDVILSLTPKLKRRMIDINVDIDPNLVINTQPGALSQVITNLTMNSLVHGFADDRAGKIDVQGAVKEGAIELQYRDDGVGMEADVKEHIFDPFFTTKRGAGGSGLGMHIVFNVVTQSLDGSVQCESAPDNGVLFRISFPVSGGKESALLN